MSRTLDLTGDTLNLPVGTWCSLTLNLDDALVMDGFRDNNNSVHIELDVISIPIHFNAPLTVGSGGAAAEIRLLPDDWFDEVFGGGSGPVDVGPGDPGYSTLVSMLGSDSVLQLL